MWSKTKKIISFPNHFYLIFVENSHEVKEIINKDKQGEKREPEFTYTGLFLNKLYS